MMKQNIKLCGMVACLLASTVFSFANVEVHKTAGFSEKSEPVPKVLGVQTIDGVRGKSIEGYRSFEKKPILINQIETDGVMAASFLVFDASSNITLMERSVDQKLPIASLTKLLTAFVAYKHMQFSSDVVIPSRKYTKVKPTAGLLPNEKTTLSDLTTAMLVGSANDAAEAIGAVVEEKEQRPFVDLINEEALLLGMTNSHFTNPVGFDSLDHYSTARDISFLVKALNDYTAFSLHGKLASFDFKTQLRSHHVVATHKLALRDEEVYAVKTGYTQEAKGSMVSRVSRDGQDIFIIVIGSPNRDEDTKMLKEAVFRSYSWN